MSTKIASLVVVVAAVACSGERMVKQRGSGEADAGEGSPGTGGSTAVGGSPSGGSAGTISGDNQFCEPSGGELWIVLDSSDCAERPEGDCTGLKCDYYSGDRFGGTPALSDCAMFSPHDGCGEVTLDFDANGCAYNVRPPPEEWDTDDHLGNLRECMTRVFAGGRFACLASRTLSFHESCFID